MRVFKNSSSMHENILIQSADVFTRIYDKTVGDKASIQDFHNFSPRSDDKSRKLILSSLRVCPRYNRVLMLFGYPKS